MSDPKLRQTPHEDDCLNYLIAPSPRRLPGYKRPVLTDAYPSAIDATMGRSVAIKRLGMFRLVLVHRYCTA